MQLWLRLLFFCLTALTETVYNGWHLHFQHNVSTNVHLKILGLLLIKIGTGTRAGGVEGVSNFYPEPHPNDADPQHFLKIYPCSSVFIFALQSESTRQFIRYVVQYQISISSDVQYILVIEKVFLYGYSNLSSQFYGLQPQSTNQLIQSTLSTSMDPSYYGKLCNFFLTSKIM
jgi:hypothetical protein